MTILQRNRNTPRRENADLDEHPVKGGVTNFGGALACLDANGWVVPGRSTVGLKPLGCAQHTASAVNDGDKTVRTRRGIFQYGNSSGGDLITRAAIGKAVFVVDDQTVGLTDGSSTRSVAGIVRDVDAQSAWVQF